MKTILSVGAFCVSILFMHIEANTDVEFHSILARLSLLEEKQASSDKRIAALEWENKLSQKRIKDLEKYKTYSDRRVVALERKNALCNRKNNELDILMKQYAHKVAIETDKLLSEKNNTMDGYDKTLSYREVTSFVNDKNRSDRTLAKPNGKDDKLTAADEMANRLTAGNVLSLFV
ncbi:hypothetical protein DPMN_064413 [Dreissena polymorpha]|uniref:Uncharacterized protein n=1 Tax=Dreissena polymorpha TaxID=45954 RepID=A0A9D4CDE9_DREPO|nr:hypothetical protein DPMN_064413 [Dreissena polymorpha]